jgi:hypothetical protein
LHHLALESPARAGSKPRRRRFGDESETPVKTIIATAALALCAAGCSASFSTSKVDDKSELDGKPTSGDDDDAGKPLADDGDDTDRSSTLLTKDGDDDAKKTKSDDLASPSPTSAVKEGDCVPGKAEGHTKDKAQGEAKGHDKPPCPDGKTPEPLKEPAKPDAKAKADPKAKTPAKAKADDDTKPADEAAAKAKASSSKSK